MIVAMEQVVTINVHRVFRVVLLGVGFVPLLVLVVRGQTGWLLLGYTALFTGNVIWAAESMFPIPVLTDVYIAVSVLGASLFFFISAYSNQRKMQELEQRLRETGEVVVG